MGILALIILFIILYTNLHHTDKKNSSHKKYPSSQKTNPHHKINPSPNHIPNHKKQPQPNNIEQIVKNILDELDSSLSTVEELLLKYFYLVHYILMLVF